MRTMRAIARFAFLLVGLLAAAPQPAAAQSTLRAFDTAVAAAMRHYRYAGYYLHTGNVGLAAIELEAMQSQWRALTKRFTAAVPDAFADDGKFAPTLAAVQTRTAAALKLLDDDKRAEALARLGPIAGMVQMLRRRNGLRVYADCIADMNAAFDAAWSYRHRPPDFADADQADRLRAAIAVVDYWYRRCRDRAPKETAKQADFQRLMEGSMASIRRLWRAARTKNRLLLINTLRELRSFDNLIYLKFG